MSHDTIIQVGFTVFILSGVIGCIALALWANTVDRETQPQDCKAIRDAERVAQQYLQRLGKSL